MTRREGALSFAHFDSPVGVLLVAGDAGRLRLIRFPGEAGPEEPAAAWRRDDALFAETFRQLDRYFAGTLTRFDLSLRLAGTAFQSRVWEAMRGIPFGRTVSYGELASRIGRPGASRAVGAASGANPVPIVVPCHRVIGSNGTLTGFGGGIETKRFLLAHERRCASPEGPQRTFAF